MPAEVIVKMDLELFEAGNDLNLVTLVKNKS